MRKILILGANGQIARVATALFLERSDIQLTLYLRKSNRLKLTNSDRLRIIEGDVLNADALEAAMAAQDVVYANLSGNMEAQAALRIRIEQPGGEESLNVAAAAAICLHASGAVR